MKLDHATIVTHDLEPTRRFFAEVVGLREGARPPFRVAGYWFYDDEHPAIHLVDATLPAATSRSAPRIDHIAFRIATAEAWRELITRLETHGVRYDLARVQAEGETQLFVTLAPGLTIEFVTDQSP